MKNLLLKFTILSALFLTSCDQTGENAIVGSYQDTLIPSLSFNVDTTYLDAQSGRLIASGTVKNNGNSNVSSPWYVEAQFYTDKTGSTKLGGNYTEIGVPLSTGQSTFWTIYFSSQNVDVTKYPDFGVKDLRGIYK
jgi:hypothetical protein